MSKKMADKKRRPKRHKLRSKSWWRKNQHKTDVEIGSELGCPTSTVRAARHRAGIPSLTGSFVSKRLWQSKEFRKKRSRAPILYEESFWEQNKHKTSSEIAKELGCPYSSVMTAREFMGIPKLNRSQAQQRRYSRLNLPKARVEISEKLRRIVLARAKFRCQIPTCRIKGKDHLQCDHIIPMGHFKVAQDANTKKNVVVLCNWHHKWWDVYKKTGELMQTIFKSKNPYKDALKLVGLLFPRAK